EGENLIVERYSTGDQEERTGELAREVVRTRPDVIVSSGTPLLLALKAATPTIPIVGVMYDPVAFGLVASMARPGGNITGVSVDAGIELWTKYLEMVREIVPTATKVGFLVSRGQWDTPLSRKLREVAGQAGISLLGPPVASPISEAAYRPVLLAM